MSVTLRPKAVHHFSDADATEEEERLASLLGGVGESARVGRIPIYLARAIQATATTVMLNKGYAAKIRFKHKVSARDLLTLKTGFRYGRVQADKRRHLVFFYPDPYTVDRTFQAAVKTNKDGTELFLLSFHEVSQRRLRSLMRRGTLLRDWPQ